MLSTRQCCIALIIGGLFGFASSSVWALDKTAHRAVIQQQQQVGTPNQWQQGIDSLQPNIPPSFFPSGAEAPNTLAEFSAQYVHAFPQAQWWTAFGDERLNTCVARAIANNPSFTLIQARVTEAKALSDLGRAPLFPQVSLSARYLLQQYGQNQFVFPLQQRTFHSYETPLAASYELDLWGKNWTAYQAGKQRWQATQHDWHNAFNQLVAQVVTAYLNVARTQALLAEQQASTTLAEAQWQHAVHRYQQQQVRAEDVTSAQQAWASQKDTLAAITTALALAKNQLHQLIALSASEPLTDEMVSPLAAIVLPSEIPHGIPSELLLHRPDVQAAEAALTAASLSVTSARRAFLPRVTLQGQTGFSAIGLDNLFKSNSLSSSFYPGVSLPLFQGGALKANTKLRKAQYTQAVAGYQSVLRNAFTDTENALQQVNGTYGAYQTAHEQWTSSQAREAHARARYQQGLSRQSDWQDLALERVAYTQALAQQKTQLLINYVGLMTALGGGYAATPAP